MPESDPLPKVLIVRTETGDDGTFGKLTTTGFECYSGELPWRDLDGNGIGDQQFSCITAGTYKVIWAESPSRKDKDGKPAWTYRLENVKGRDGVLIHSANFCGDSKLGFLAQVLGCIALGRSITDIETPVTKKKQKGLTSSRDAVSAFVDHMEREPFELTVSWAENCGPKKLD